MHIIDENNQRESFVFERLSEAQSAVRTHYAVKVNDSCFVQTLDYTVADCSIVIIITHYDGAAGHSTTYKRRFDYHYDFKTNQHMGELDSQTYEFTQNYDINPTALTPDNCVLIDTFRKYKHVCDVINPPSLAEMIKILNSQIEGRKKEIREEDYDNDKFIHRTHRDITNIEYVQDMIEEYKNVIAKRC